MNKEKWFIEKIGTRIYRDKNSCNCHTCEKNFKEGLVVHDLQHAGYLYECQYDDILEKDLNYRSER